MRYTRISDGQAVSDSEALDARGKVRPGFNAVLADGERADFSMAFMESAARTTFTDAESANIVARAEMIHATSNAYLGDRAPAFTDRHAQLALQQAAHDRERMAANTAKFTADAAIADVERQIARHLFEQRLSNAWKN